MRLGTGLALALAVAASACAPKAGRVILMPDRDGHVGVVTVTNAKGSVVLDEPQEGVTVANAQTAPSRPEPVSSKTIQAIFSEALAVEPPAPLVCIVYFATGSADVEAEGARAVENAIAEITRRRSVDVSVDGHSDTAGDPDVNMRLSLARAQAVRDRLVAAGVPAGIITLRYHGKGDLLVPTGDNVAEPRNRRVEVVVR
jgi:outer membrane protein OmpA-like peptidoglycan-associated protein